MLIYVKENVDLRRRQIIVRLKMRRSPEKGVKWNQKEYQAQLLVAVHLLCLL
jgi:hypothetical protein